MSSQTREIMHDQHSHPVHGTWMYWKIGIILTLVTFIEIGAFYYEEALGALSVPLILIVSAIKFILVVAYYMHLKYDSKVFSGIFLFPMALATLVIFALILLYHVLHPLR